MFKRIVSLTVSLGLLLQQTVFAYTSSLNLSNYLNSGANLTALDRFRPISLRYFSYQPLTNDFKVLLDKGDTKDIADTNLKGSASVLLDYFKIGLSLPNDKFWVNLRPDSEDEIIDEELAKTDLGKIMLEADLKLKQDTALFTSPSTPQGKEYWNRLYKRAGELFGTENITIPTLTRPWIVPGEIILRESNDKSTQGAYIYKANLKVMLEEDYLKSSQLSAISSQQYEFNDPRLKELNQYSTQLIRELILPRLTQKVNSSKDYANLRQVYFSLILARWFKETFSPQSIVHSPQNNDSYIKLIDSNNLTNLTSKQAWDKTTYFNSYQKSFQEGEYNLSEPIYTPTGQVIRRYMSGGTTFQGKDMGKPSFTGPGENMFSLPAEVKNKVLFLNGKDVQKSDAIQAEGQMEKTAASAIEYDLSKAIVTPSITTALGSKTLRVEVAFPGGAKGYFVNPAGTSTGEDERAMLGAEKNAEKIIESVNKIHAAVIQRGLKANQLAEIGQLMLEMDTKGELGAEATLSYQMAVAWALAKQLGLEDYELIRKIAPDIASKGIPKTKMMDNNTNGGEHADNNLDMQEFMIAPVGETAADENRMSDEVDEKLGLLYQHLGLTADPYDRGVGKLRGKEGGYNIENLTLEKLKEIYSNPEKYSTKNLNVAALRDANTGIHEFVLECQIAAIKDAGYRPSASREVGTVGLTLDPATTSMLVDESNPGVYIYEGRNITSNELIDIYAKWVEKYPIISIEDGLSENDWDGWMSLIEQLGHKVLLIGDDLLVTQGGRLMKLINMLEAKGFIDGKLGKVSRKLGILIKLNQNGFLTTGINDPDKGYLGTIEVIRLAKKYGFEIVVSHRSKEAGPEEKEVSIAALAAGVDAIFLKSGNRVQATRAVKKDRLAEIDRREREKAKKTTSSAVAGETETMKGINQISQYLFQPRDLVERLGLDLKPVKEIPQEEDALSAKKKVEEARKQPKIVREFTLSEEQAQSLSAEVYNHQVKDAVPDFDRQAIEDTLSSGIQKIHFFLVPDLKNNSPALIIRKHNHFDIDYVDYKANKIYLAQGITEELLKHQDKKLLTALLLKNLYIMERLRNLASVQKNDFNYSQALRKIKIEASKIENALVESRMAVFVKEKIDAFTQEYLHSLKDKNVLWDGEYSILSKEDGNALVGGKSFQQSVYTSDEPIRNLKSQAATTYASVRFLESDKTLLPRINNIVENLDTSDPTARIEASEKIERLILNTPVPADIEKEIEDNFEVLQRVTGIEKNAVRSAGKAEDFSVENKELVVSLGANAGMHLSDLGVKDKKEAVSSWRACVASLFTERVLDYRDGIMVALAMDSILGNKEIAKAITQRLQDKKDQTKDEECLLRALKIKNAKAISSLRLKNVLTQNGFSDLAAMVDTHRQKFMNVEEIAMGVTIMPMAGVRVAFVNFGHEITSEWTGLSFQDIEEKDYLNKGRVVCVTVAPGLGESIVQGKVIPDVYLVHIFTDANGQEHINIINRQLGTKAVQTVYTYQVKDKLKLKNKDLEDYFNILSDKPFSGNAQGLKADADAGRVKAVLTKLIAQAVDKTSLMELSQEESGLFAFNRQELNQLAHLLKAISKNKHAQTMFTDVPQEWRNSFCASESEIIGIAREFIKKSKNYNDLVDMEGGVGKNIFGDHSKVIPTVSVDQVPVADVAKSLSLDHADIQDYIQVLDGQGDSILRLKGVKEDSDVSAVRDVLVKLKNEPAHKISLVQLTSTEEKLFSFDRQELTRLAQLLRATTGDINAKTAYVEVIKAPQLLKDHNVAVTVQRRPSNVKGDVDEPSKIRLSYAYVDSLDAEAIYDYNKQKNITIKDGIYQGQVLINGFPTRQAFAGQIYRIPDEDADDTERLKFHFAKIKEIADAKQEVIIVTRETTPDYISILKHDYVLGVVGFMGGPTSHAAVVSRELKLATVVGIQSWLEKLQDKDKDAYERVLNYLNTSGNFLTVDANPDEKNGNGTIYAGVLPTLEQEIEISVDDLPYIRTKIGYIMGMPFPMLEMSKIAKYSGFSGVALMRGEFAYGEENINPRFGQAYDNLLIYNYLMTLQHKDYYNTLSQEEKDVLVKYKDFLSSREDQRRNGRLVPRDRTEAVIKKFLQEGSQNIAVVFNAYEMADIVKLKTSKAAKKEITRVAKQIVGYISYSDFFDSIHGSAVAMMAAANNVDRNTVVYRSIDFKKNEARNLIGSVVFDPEREAATMIGERGARWLLRPENQGILREEVRALLRKVAQGYTNLGFMFPFVSRPEELDQLLTILEEEEKLMTRQLSEGLGRNYLVYLREVGQMIELPSNIIEAESFLKVLKKHEANTKDYFKRAYGVNINRKSFFSFGTNDLTQLTMGVDRDNPLVKHLFREGHHFIVESVRHVANLAKKYNVKCGLCGQLFVNLSKSNVKAERDAAEEIMLILGETDGYAGTDYLGTHATVFRARSATVKHGQLDKSVAQKKNALAAEFTATLSKGAGAAKFIAVKNVDDFKNAYLGYFAVVTADVSEEMLKTRLEDEPLKKDKALKERIGWLGAIMYSRQAQKETLEKIAKDLEIPLIRITEDELRRVTLLPDKSFLTVDFNGKAVYEGNLKINTVVPPKSSRIEVPDAAQGLPGVGAFKPESTLKSAHIYQEVKAHPFTFLSSDEGKQKLRQLITNNISAKYLTGNKADMLKYETFDLQSDDLLALDSTGQFLKKAEINPPLGAFGLEALIQQTKDEKTNELKNTKWRELFILEMQVIASFVKEGYNIAIQFNSVRDPQSIQEAVKVLEDVGIDIRKTPLGINSCWPGNYLFPQEFINNGNLSFIQLDSRRLAQGYLAADLFKNETTKEFYDYNAIKDHLIYPEMMILRAAAKNNISVERVEFEGGVASSSMVTAETGQTSGQTAKKVLGGIDFRQMNMLIQPQGSFASSSLDFSLPALSKADIESFDLDTELAAIQRMADSGIAPSYQRLKEYLAVCFAKERTGKDIDNLKLCLLDIFEREQFEAKETTDGYKEVLVIADTRGYVLKEDRLAAIGQNAVNLN